MDAGTVGEIIIIIIYSWVLLFYPFKKKNKNNMEVLRDGTNQTIPVVYLNKKKYPLMRKEFPKAQWMTMSGDKFRTLKDAKQNITRKMVKRGYAKPKFDVIR